MPTFALLFLITRAASGGGSEFIEAELDGGLFVKKGYSDVIVERITRWIDDNATLDRPGDKNQK